MTFQIQTEKKCNVQLKDRKTTDKQKKTKHYLYHFYALQSLMLDVAMSSIILSCHSPLNQSSS